MEGQCWGFRGGGLFVNLVLDILRDQNQSSAAYGSPGHPGIEHRDPPTRTDFEPQVIIQTTTDINSLQIPNSSITFREYQPIFLLFTR